MRATKTLDLPFEVKSIDDEGRFTGYAAVFGNVDLGGDVIVKGAFARTLSHSKGAVPILWHHDVKSPVGLGLTASEDDHGMVVEGQLDLNTEKGRDVHSGMKMGYIASMSIGYDIPKGGAETKDGVRYLKEIALAEYSLLTKGWAMNPEAVVTDVKSFSFADALATRAAESDLSERYWNLDDALGTLRHEIEESELDAADKADAYRSALHEHADAMADWFADWLALEDDDKAACPGEGRKTQEPDETYDPSLDVQKAILTVALVRS